MDLSLTENQEMLKSSAREFMQREYTKQVLLDLDGRDTSYSQELWDKVTAIGWLGIVIPQEYGGEGSSLTDAGVLFQELGRGPVPGPYFSSSILGALVTLEGGTEAQKQRVLPAIASGEFTLALAITESNYGWGASMGTDDRHPEKRRIHLERREAIRSRRSGSQPLHLCSPNGRRGRSR